MKWKIMQNNGKRSLLKRGHKLFQKVDELIDKLPVSDILDE
jgi:hypothetical protein